MMLKTSPVSDRQTELTQQTAVFGGLLQNTDIALDAIHIRTVQEWKAEAERELGEIAGPKNSFRDLALGARAQRIEEEERAQEAEKLADRKQREAQYPAARAIVEAALVKLCGELPDHEIEWTGHYKYIDAKIHMSDVTLGTTFSHDFYNQNLQVPVSVRFTYNNYYFDSLATLGKLIEDREAQDAYEAAECGG